MTVFEINNKIEEAFNPTIDKYVMYLRKSRADLEAEKDGGEETLARHKKILTELAVRKNLYVEKIYEEVVSGETIEARSEIQKLIKDCYAGKYKGIIVMEISRLSRGNQGDAQIIMDCLRFSNANQGVLVVTPSKTYDIAHNSDDEEYMEFELFMSRREYKMIKRRLDRGRVQAVVEGNYVGSKRPYGFNIVKTRRSRTLEPNEDEAPIVRMIFEWSALENMSYGKIAERLDNMGVPSYNKTGWNRSTIKDMLSNTLYIGKVQWFKRVKIKTMIGDELRSIVTKHTDQTVLYDGKHDGIVDEEIFNIVQNRFTSSRTRRSYSLVNPLAGLMSCSKCGYSMELKHYKDFDNSRYKHSQYHGCHVKAARVKDVIDAVTHSLKTQIEDIELKIDNTVEVDVDTMEMQVTMLRNELKKLEQRKSKLFDGWEEGNITDNEFVERKTIIADRIDSILKQIDEIENTIPEQGEIKDKLISLHAAFDMLGDGSIDAKIKNDYLKQVISNIEFSRENDYEFILDVTFR